MRIGVGLFAAVDGCPLGLLRFQRNRCSVCQKTFKILQQYFLSHFSIKVHYTKAIMACLHGDPNPNLSPGALSHMLYLFEKTHRFDIVIRVHNEAMVDACRLRMRKRLEFDKLT